MNDVVQTNEAGPILRLKRFGIQWRYRMQALADGAVVVVAMVVAVVLRFEFTVADVDWDRTLALAVIAALVQIAVGMLTGLYAGAHRYASFDEVIGIARALALSTLIVAVLNRLALDRLVPVSASVLYGLLALVGCLSVRATFRLLLDRRRRPDPE